MPLYGLNILADLLRFFPAIFAFGIAWLCGRWFASSSEGYVRVALGSVIALALTLGVLLVIVGVLIVA